MPTQPKKLSCEVHGVSKGRSGLDERAQKTVEHLERQESASSLSNQTQETKGCQRDWRPGLNLPPQSPGSLEEKMPLCLARLPLAWGGGGQMNKQ